MNKIYKKWIDEILFLLNKREHGFNEIVKKINITPNTLSYKLKILESNNLIKKNDKYFITQKGEYLLNLIYKKI